MATKLRFDATGRLGSRHPVITVESQLHGYRQGHELLSTSISLPKSDQIIIDRLSDITGPLSSGEIFKPYLTGYPLPSGSHYVLARTWQDLTVQRAGCVRTLSLLIPIEFWSSALSLEAFYSCLEFDDLPSYAEQVILEDLPPRSLPSVENFQGNELLEALFLEDSKPVAVIDAVDPELITLRVLTALWPSVRRKFAVSTFVLSPRRIDGKDFDLVFVPKTARSRFADWHGRRIDGRAGNNSRHRWTNSMMERVFGEPTPQLLTDNEIEIIGSYEGDAGSALRVALLWDELQAKLENSPFALLGLLDIADSRKDSAPTALISLKKLLGETAFRAVRTLPSADAWQFINSISLKLDGTPLASELTTIASAAGILTEMSPEGAIAFLNQQDPSRETAKILSAIAENLGKNFSVKTEMALLSALPNTLIRLLEIGGQWIGFALKIPLLIQHIEEVLSSCTLEELGSFKQKILPYLLENSQVKVAQSIFMVLDSEELLQKVLFLSEEKNLSYDKFIPLLIERARKLDIIFLMRARLLLMDETPSRNKFIFSTLKANIDDINWLIEESHLKKQKLKGYIIDLLRSASSDQLSDILDHENLCVKISDIIGNDADDLLLNIFEKGRLPTDIYVKVAIRLLNIADGELQTEIAFLALNRGLSQRFGKSELHDLSILLSAVDDVLNGGWAAQEGLNSVLSHDIINRNFIVFNQAPNAARNAIINAIEYLATFISYRQELDITEEAAISFAEILLDAEEKNPAGLVIAAGQLLPLLFRSTNYPISKVILATFPIVYRELASHDNVQDVLKFIPFLDWDKCKAARIELVNAFLKSPVWAPEDLLLVACLCQDEDRIIKQVKKSYGGTTFIKKLKKSVTLVPNKLQHKISVALKEID